jgi:hypothetical protein
VKLAVALAAVLLAAVPAAGATTKAARIQTFRTPSGHIGCAYDTTMLRCDVDDVADPAARPRSCDLDYGSAFAVTKTGRARRLCVGDTAMDPDARVLAYGRTRRYGPFTCTSRTTGLRCTTAAGHGFTLSRDAQKLF